MAAIKALADTRQAVAYYKREHFRCLSINKEGKVYVTKGDLERVERAVCAVKRTTKRKSAVPRIGIVEGSASSNRGTILILNDYTPSRTKRDHALIGAEEKRDGRKAESAAYVSGKRSNNDHKFSSGTASPA